jgi:hypothetical protein
MAPCGLSHSRYFFPVIEKKLHLLSDLRRILVLEQKTRLAVNYRLL